MLFPLTERKGRGREMGALRSKGGEEEGAGGEGMRRKERPKKVRE